MKKLIGPKNGNWKGGKHHRKDGYRMIRKDGNVLIKDRGAKYKLEHRVIMEEYLGRKLLEKEIIHHKNGVKDDNRIENLQILTQSEHAKIDSFKRIRNIKGRFI